MFLGSSRGCSETGPSDGGASVVLSSSVDNGKTWTQARRRWVSPLRLGHALFVLLLCFLCMLLCPPRRPFGSRGREILDWLVPFP